ncbi:hypothetical protein [Lactococcus fujiensis]|uniref:Uncharacterized protein n=1 Tax=Lactococcus fujiensis JCM 16395 TaxID=1291764 RepID=A0A2A5RPX8_9LACT|nr:hypothetical protein [Lactococcus fujiensis]PCS01439.1 hypothetical protein RT41_GL000203 [Lactococcus fujiensis JCM 16395]
MGHYGVHLDFIAIVGGLAGFIPADNNTTTNSSDQPTKTSASNEYVEQKGEEAATGRMSLVDDAVYRSGSTFLQQKS